MIKIMINVIKSNNINSEEKKVENNKIIISKAVGDQ